MNKISKKLLPKSQQAILLVLAVFMAIFTPVAIVQADSFDAQIQALRKESEQFQARAGQLRSKANTLRNQLDALQADKNALQTQIELNETRLQQIKAEIVQTEERIDNQQQLLGDSLRESYLEASISPLEMLASSSSISDFIDKQEYRNSIQDSIELALDQIRELKKELNEKRIDSEETLADQKSQRKEMAAKEHERSRLLAQTQGEEDAYQKLTRANSKKISKLQAEQAALNAQMGGKVRIGPACGGGYSGGWPWCTAAMNSYIDNWGMYSRQCVSYTAFKVAVSGRHMPYWGGSGNANQWPGNARAAGLPVDRSPSAGDVAVWPVGYYGHTMYVESVLGNGDIFVSEYNYDWSGHYSERVISKANWQAQGFEFITFR